MSELLYLVDAGIHRCEARIRSVVEEAEVLGLILDRTPFFVKGAGQPSDVGIITGPRGHMDVLQVVRLADDRVVHRGKLVGGFREGDSVVAAIDSEWRRTTARVHTAGELICAAVYQLGRRWQVSAASHVPGQSRVAFTSDLTLNELATFVDALKAQVSELVRRDEPVRASLDVDENEAKRLCPLDADSFGSKKGGIRLISPIPGFHRPCTGAHVARTGDIGEIHFRKTRLRDGDLSITYDVV
ncbi:MAG TPA: alanyl-tRNA editing protein [Allosphingosinicella sp.]|nr:alanyl-tRNA editing protein [Allosphingosinicella sp.]